MNNSTKDVPSIVLKISYDKIITLDEMTDLYSKFSNEYSSFAKSVGYSNVPLCVKEIKSGSIEIILSTPEGITSIAAASMALVIEHSQLIVEFGKHLKIVFDALLYNNEIDDANKNNLSNLGGMVNVIASNPNSNIDIKFYGSMNNSPVNINIGNQDALTMQRTLQTKLENEEQCAEYEEKEVILFWDQVKRGEGSSDGRTGDKAIIESINPKSLNVYFPDGTADIKKIMTAQENNPLKKFYIVDVVVKMSKGKPVAYFIKKFHQELEMDD